MSSGIRRVAILTGVVSLLGAAVGAQEWDSSLEVGVELRLFPRETAATDQDDVTLSPSLTLSPEISLDWNDGGDRLTLIPFLRLDADDDGRTHGDIRELHWTHQSGTWSLQVGAGKVFWGVTESRHLVDIINQTDLVEDLDQEEKLGQPMVNLTLERSWGVIDLFAMPYFRERTFPAPTARLRGPLPVEEDEAQYASSQEEWHPDVAARYATTLGPFDLGLGHFHGTSREPRFELMAHDDGPRLRPHYDVIDQTSLDLQWTREAWLWKLETIVRQGQPADTFAATVLGVEYTLYQLGESDIDLGLLGEVLYDGRDSDPALAPPTLFDHDVFAGFRLAMNDIADTTLLAGAIVDTKSGETFVLAEAQRRLGSRWLAELDARFLVNVEPGGPGAAFERDGYVTFRMTLFL